MSRLRPVRLHRVPGILGNRVIKNSSAKQRREITPEHPLFVSPEEHREFIGRIRPDAAEFDDDLLHLPRRTSLPEISDSPRKLGR